jgi:two-component system sensor histidine kinase DevS
MDKLCMPRQTCAMGGNIIAPADRPIGRPRQRLLELALLSLVAIAIVLFTALALPIANIKVERFDTSRLTLRYNDVAIRLPHDLPLVLIPARGPLIALHADTLLDGIVSSGGRAEKRAWWAKREAIARAFLDGPVTLRFADGRVITGVTRARTLADLTVGFWAAIFTGFAGLLCGLWILVLRPRNNAARTFAVMSLGLFGIGCTLAAGNDPLLLGRTYHILMLINHACVQIFAAAILMLFCRFPTPRVRQRWMWVIAAAAVALTVADMADLTPDPIATLFASIVVEFIIFVLLVLGQIWAVRSDPVGSAAMRLIGSSALLSSALFVGMIILPMLVSGAPLISEAIGLPLLLVIYAGLGAAIARTRLFTVDGWVPGLLLSVCAAIAITGVDLAILGLAARSDGIALPIAIVTVGIVYLPLRQSITRRADRRRHRAEQRSLRRASEMVFAVTPEARAERWLAALTALFDPLEAGPDADPVAKPALNENRAALRVPPIGDVPGMVLRYAQRGQRDFDSVDLDQLHEMIAVIDALMDARDAYVRGTANERARIVRDLHDDVSARLLTSLHREDPAMMRTDIREAMAEIRAIVFGGTGMHCLLEDVIADMRFEMSNRLEAHGIALVWPITTLACTTRTIDQASARHLMSILREITSNVVRHSGAGCVTLEMLGQGDRLAFRIADDGIGFDAAREWGNGLLNTARRAALLGGSFQIGPDPTGTLSTFDIKLTAKTEAAMEESAAVSG